MTLSDEGVREWIGSSGPVECLGLPGSGKTTLARHLSRRAGIAAGCIAGRRAHVGISFLSPVRAAARILTKRGTWLFIMLSLLPGAEFGRRWRRGSVVLRESVKAQVTEGRTAVHDQQVLQAVTAFFVHRQLPSSKTLKTMLTGLYGDGGQRTVLVLDVPPAEALTGLQSRARGSNHNPTDLDHLPEDEALRRLQRQRRALMAVMAALPEGMKAIRVVREGGDYTWQDFDGRLDDG